GLELSRWARLALLDPRAPVGADLVARRGIAGRRADPHLAAGLGRLCRKARGLVGGDLEAGLELADADRADIALQHAAGLADHRQQPFGIGAVLAAERQAEPLRAFHRGARLAGLVRSVLEALAL